MFSNSLNTLSPSRFFLVSVMGLYVLCSLFIIAVFTFPDWISALLIAPNVFFIPLLFGFSLITLFSLKNIENDLCVFLLSFLFGSTILTFTSVLLQLLRITFASYLPYISLMPFVLMYLCFTIKIIKKCGSLRNLCYFIYIIPKKYYHNDKLKIFCIILIFVLSLLPPSIIALYRPIGTIGIDHMAGVEFIQPIERLINDGVLDYWKARSMPVLIAGIPLMLSNVSAIDLYWALPFITTPIFALGMFFFVFYLTNKYSIGLASATLLPFLNGGHGLFHCSVPHVFRYITLATVVLPWVLFCIYYLAKKNHTLGLDSKKSTLSSFIITLLMGVFILLSTFVQGFNPLGLQREEITSFMMLGGLALIIFYDKFLNITKVTKYLTLSFLFSGLFFLTLDPMEPFIFLLFGVYLFIGLFYIAMIKKSSIIKKWRNFDGIFLLRFLVVLTCIFLFIALSGLINDYSFSFDRTSLSGSSYSLDSKINALIAANSEFVIIIFALSLAILSLSDNKIDLIMVILSLFGLGLYFGPISATITLPQHVLCLLMSYVISAGLFRIVNIAIKRNKELLQYD